MTLAELNTLLNTTGLPVAYMNFPEDEHISMPFITYCEVNSNNMGADDITYNKGKVVEIDLWTRFKDETSEAKVEAALKDLYWDSLDSYESEDYCFRRIYTIYI